MKITRSTQWAVLTVFGQIGEINGVAEDRLRFSSQGPRKPIESNYYIDVTYRLEGRAVVVDSIEIRLTNAMKKSWLMYESGLHEGEAALTERSPLRNFYLEYGGDAIWELTQLILDIEERHDLRNLASLGPDALPLDDDEWDGCDLLELSEDEFFDQDFVDANLAAD